MDKYFEIEFSGSVFVRANSPEEALEIVLDSDGEGPAVIGSTKEYKDEAVMVSEFYLDEKLFHF